MKLQDIFTNKIHRSIETVIKADDRDHILQEVKEYVITNELAQKLGLFFETYREQGNVNGVWISGFFGSGKSHLLKILSYVLENKEHDGEKLGELFAEKAPIDDPKLKGDIKACTRIPSESILFNIDQQAQITSKADENAILHVFYKVFYDHQGFYGFRPHIAAFENWLAAEGKFEDFKTGFEKHFNKPWEKERSNYVNPLVEDAVAETLAELYGTNAEKWEGILEKYEDEQKYSIEDFAQKVKAYIDSKNTGFRLNFYVDEVGQYIAENTRLMLNLQTIAESLDTVCKGNSWVIVTSQEDLTSLLGDDSAAQSDDFSKIKGRFRIPISLTSSNVDEVIEKRLLEKKDDSAAQLKTVWKKEHENLTSLLSFSDLGIQFKQYQGDYEFVNKFPFVPYQFDLFQQCIKQLSKHNAFQGKHQSVGERSMLGVFQEILKKMATRDLNALVSFDLTFEGQRGSFRSEVYGNISLAEKQLSYNPLAVKVLKALFMVKYYDSFKTTERNIAVLMIDDLHVDLNAHNKKIKEALNLLEQQTYIQKVGENYEFLTDDEKDVENEIKSTPLEQSEIQKQYHTLLFDGIIKDNRFQFFDNKQYFEFASLVDGNLYSRDKELKIEIQSPSSKEYENEKYCTGQTMGINTHIILKLANNERIDKEIRLYLQTQKYVRQNQNTGNNDTKKKILVEKSQQNEQQRKKQILETLKELLANATVYLNGTVHKVRTAADAKTKVIYAFQDLIKLAYPKLSLLNDVDYTEETLNRILRQKKDDLFHGDNGMSNAESEVLQYILRRKRQNDRTSISDIKDWLGSKPYGWNQMAALSMCAMLYRRGKIEAKQDTNTLELDDFAQALNNNRQWGNTLLYPEIEYDQSQLRKLKELHREFFNETNPYSEPKEMATYFKQKVSEEYKAVYQILAQRVQYPFVSKLDPLAELLDRISDFSASTIITQIQNFTDELLDLKEEHYDPIKQFLGSEQKKIFDKIGQFKNSNNANFQYIQANELDTLAQVQESAAPYRGNLMQQGKQAIDALSQKLKDAIALEKDKALKAIESIKESICLKPEFAQLNPEQQSQITAPFDSLLAHTQEVNFIANIRQNAHEATNLETKQLNLLVQLSRPKNDPAPKVEYIKSSNIRLSFHKRELENDADVNAYVDALKEAMLDQIAKNRKITLG